MMTKNNIARLAGFVYLLLVITGIIYLVYVPSQLIDWQSAEITVKNIMEAEFLFRLGIVAGVISSICFLILPLVLYELLKSINKTYAVLMVVLAVVSVPISLFNMINKIDVLTLLSGAQYLSVFNVEHLHSQVMILLKSYNNGISLVQIFWGLWLFPFGYLVFKSNYLPKFLGICLMLGCFEYLISFFGIQLYPNVKIPSFVGYAHSIGEIGICLWLLVMGVKDKQIKADG